MAPFVLPFSRLRQAGIAIAFLALTPGAAFGCACCAEPGERGLQTITIDDYIAQELARMRPAPVANLFLTVCGPDCISGIKNPQETYTVDPTKTNLPTQITLGDETGGSGTLTIRTPLQLQQFVVDVTPNPALPAPLLFKEWRLPVLVSGTGIFEPALTNELPAELIFQGSGNSCSQAEDFTDWRIDINAADVNFALFGQLTPPP